MKNKFTLTMGAVVAFAFIAAIAVIRKPQPVKAQDEVGPPIHVRSDRNTISTGMVGLALGQTIRINVVDTTPPPVNDAGCPCQRVILNFRDTDGLLVRRGDGSVVQQSIELQPGRATSLDLNYDELPPGPTRQQLRAVVRFADPGGESESGGFEQPPPVNDRFETTIEVFDNTTGRTQLFTNPAVLKGFNPQPDPPRVNR